MPAHARWRCACAVVVSSGIAVPPREHLPRRIRPCHDPAKGERYLIRKQAVEGMRCRLRSRFTSRKAPQQNVQHPKASENMLPLRPAMRHSAALRAILLLRDNRTATQVNATGTYITMVLLMSRSSRDGVFSSTAAHVAAKEQAAGQGHSVYRRKARAAARQNSAGKRRRINRARRRGERVIYI